MKSLINSVVATIALGSVSVAQADLIDVTAIGQVYFSEDASNFFGAGAGDGTLVGETVTAYWRFNTDNAPPDIDSNPDVGNYRDIADSTDWINSWVEMSGTNVSVGSGALADPDSFGDYVRIDESFDCGVGCGFTGSDRYVVWDSERNADFEFVNYAYFYTWIEDIINGVSLAQTFDYAPVDSDFTLGSFRLIDGDTGEYVYRVSYRLDTLTVTTVPEPGTLALFGIGLLGIAASRRRKKA